MKLSAIAIALCASSFATAFHVAPPPAATGAATSLNMFGGAGEGKPKEDNPEEMAQMEKAAKAMGMSVGEYSVAMNARVKLAQELDSTKVTGGKAETVSVERDVNNPPKSLEVKITDAGKELGKDALSKELVAALKSASEASKKGRADAQKKMMVYIQEQMKQ